jgi:hypothetical protein
VNLSCLTNGTLTRRKSRPNKEIEGKGLIDGPKMLFYSPSKSPYCEIKILFTPDFLGIVANARFWFCSFCTGNNRRRGNQAEERKEEKREKS